MTLNVEALLVRYGQLRIDAQIRFLANLASKLTIAARDGYGEEGTVANPPLLRAINEMQHKILGHLGRLLSDDADRYPDRVLIESLYAIAESNRCADHLRIAIDEAFRVSLMDRR